MAGAIKGITIEFRGDTTKLDKALRSVQGDLRKTQNELTATNKALKFNPGNVDLWKNKQQLLTTKIKETKEKLDVLKQAQAKMDAAGVDHTSEEYMKLQREIIETESQLKHFKAEHKSIGNVNLRALGEQFKQMGDKMQAAGKTMTQYVTLPLAAIGAVSAKSFADVDKTMQLTNATMGNTKEQADLLNKAMKDAAANSTFGMNDAATATLNFARAGLTAEQAAAALAPAMNLAAGEGGNLDTVSAGLVATINGFQGSFDDAAKYADVFANACNNSALDIDSLASSMSIAAPVFKAAGYDVNDAALYMGVMANNGIEASEAANALKSGLARLLPDAKGGKKAMEEFGWSILDADGNMKDTVTIQKELHDAFANMTEEQQIATAQTMFGTTQYSKWLALINTAPEDVEKLAGQIGELGTTEEMAAAMMSGFGGSIEKLKSSVDVAKTSLGEALAPIILKVAEGIQKLVDWFNNLSPAAQRVIAVVGVIVAAIGPLLVIIGTLLSAVGSILIYLPMIGTALSMLAGPVGIVIAIIAALIAIGVLLYKNWDTIKEKAAEIRDRIVETWENLKASVVAIWNTIKATIISTWDSIKTGVKNAIETVKTTITNIWNTIKSTTTTVWNGIKTSINTTVENIRSTVQSKIDAVKTAVTNSFNTIKSTATTVWNAIKKAMTDPIDAAKKKIEDVMSKLKSKFPFNIGKIIKLSLPKITLNTGSKTVLGKTITYPTGFSISWHKKGGIFTEPIVLGGHGFGEAGAEGIIPLDEFWHKMDRIAEAANSSGGGITINVYAQPGMDERKIAEMVERRLTAVQKQRQMAWQ